MLVARDLVGATAFLLVAKLAVHPPGDPQQQDAACQDQADDLQELRNDSAKMIRSTSAAMTPIRMTFLRFSAGNPAASAPTTIALSPARTISMNRISKNAAMA